MAKYRTGPAGITAERYSGPELVAHGDPLPKGVPSAIKWDIADMTGDRYPCVYTERGKFWVYPGDWIVTYPNGETMPCRMSVFEATYEPAE